MMHAFYSEKGANYGGTVFWEDKNGNLFEICCVYRSKEDGEREYKWDDRIYVGEVERYVRKGKRGITEIFLNKKEKIQ